MTFIIATVKWQVINWPLNHKGQEMTGISLPYLFNALQRTAISLALVSFISTVIKKALIIIFILFLLNTL